MWWAATLSLLGIAAGMMHGCGGGRTVAQAPAASTRVEREIGLEAVSWISVADDARVARVLGAYADRQRGVDARTAELWARNGLRVVEVPIEDAARVEAELNDPTAVRALVERQWLGQAFTWTTIVRGPATTSPSTLVTDAEPVRVPAGDVRLLARVWLGPGTSGGDEGRLSADGMGPPAPVATGGRAAVLRIELMPAHREQAAPGAGGAEQELPFARLRGEIRADGRFAYVLIPEEPGVIWQSAADGRQPPAEPGAEDEPRGRTLGAAMLEGGAYRAPIVGPTLPARNRRVVLLLPRVPERFELGAR